MPKIEPTDINKLIVSTQTLFEKQAGEKGVHFHNQLAPDLPNMDIDPNQIDQVLINVLINAMDAMPDGGDITFSSRLLIKYGQPDSADKFRITVEDSGAGIPDEHLQNIFDPFFSTKEDGTGLGLPLSLVIIENHGGRLRISSQKNIGTAVIIECPVHSGRAGYTK